MSKINVNENVSVTLTEFGVAMMRVSRAFTKHDYAEDTKVLSTQLWTLMRVFGPAMYTAATDMPFVGNEITIEDQPGPAKARGKVSQETEKQLAEMFEAIRALNGVTTARPVADSSKAVEAAAEDEGSDPCSNCLGICEGCSHEPASASPTPRFRVTTNGEKFRVEELSQYKINPGGDSCILVERWEPGCGGSTLLHKDTQAEAEDMVARIIERKEKAARPWVPVKGRR